MSMILEKGYVMERSLFILDSVGVYLLYFWGGGVFFLVFLLSFFYSSKRNDWFLVLEIRGNDYIIW